MKTLKNFVAALTCTFAFAASAHAGLIPVDSGVTNYQLDANVAGKKSITLNFDVNAQLAAAHQSLQDIFSATLKVVFSDPNDGQEKYTVLIGMSGADPVGGSGNNQINNGNSPNVFFELNMASLDYLKLDGKINALVTATAGEFFIDSAVLNVSTNKDAPAAGVPEPASLALLGMGLLGFGAVRRRRS